MSERPAVAVVLPFHGGAEAAAAALNVLARLRTQDGDELVLADNTPGAVAAGLARPDRVNVAECEVKADAYAARNTGAERTAAPWILFVDADCEPDEDLLARYFEPRPDDRCGALAGPVVGDPGQPGLIPDYIRSRGHLDQEWQLRHPYRPMAVTANLLVRRTAFEEVGGFTEGTISGADADFCWRLQDAGWELGYRAEAGVRHRHRETLRALLAQARRDGSAAPWLARRHPGYPPRVPLGRFARALAGSLGWPLLGQPRRGLFKALDGLWSAAFNAGSLLDDASTPGGPLGAAAAVVLVEEFPAAGDPLASALGGKALWVEAVRRPVRADWRAGRNVPTRYWEDENALTRRRAGGLPAARRIATAKPRAELLAEPGLTATAMRLASRAGRRDLRVEALPADRADAARRVERLP